MVYFIKNCKHVVATDTDIFNVCIKLLDSCGLDYKYIHNVHKHNQGIKTFEVDSQETMMIDEIKVCVQKNERFLVCSDSKKYAQNIHVKIGKKGKLFTK